MQALKIIWISGLIFLAACSEVQDIEFLRVRRLELIEIREGNIIAQAEAVFNNPNKRGGKVKKAEIIIIANDREAAKVVRDSPFRVQPNSEFTIPLDMEIKFEELAKNFLGSLLSREKEKTLPLHFQGYLWITMYGITKKIPVEYDATLKLKF